jgi:hypothetical protein
MKQKDYVISEVKRVLGTRFTPFVTNAILILSNLELELIKENTFNAILSQQVEYSGLNQPPTEIKAYARSMVMNHLKKAKELNGNLVYSTSAGKVQAVKAVDETPKGIVTSVLPKELFDYLAQLV